MRTTDSGFEPHDLAPGSYRYDDAVVTVSVDEHGQKRVRITPAKEIERDIGAY